MEIFLSWAGTRSHGVAQLFMSWLPRVLQAARPFLSSESIAKGSSWPDDLAAALGNSGGVGIFFITPEALKSQWVLFEAGRISGIGHQRVCVVRVGIDRLDPPLGLYQSSALTREDIQKLVNDLNVLLPKPVPLDNLARTFDWAWPDLEQELQKLAEQANALAASAPAIAPAAAPVSSEKVLNALDRVEARLGSLEERLAHTDRAVRTALATPTLGPQPAPTGLAFTSGGLGGSNGLVLGSGFNQLRREAGIGSVIERYKAITSPSSVAASVAGAAAPTQEKTKPTGEV
jgi:ElaB/YqjD/DUF883 family membrane-anchored ribosome-binding protein